MPLSFNHKHAYASLYLKYIIDGLIDKNTLATTQNINNLLKRLKTVSRIKNII